MENEKRETGTVVKLLILCLAVAIIVIDGTVLNVSIKEIVKDLGTDLKQIQWAITGYSLVLAALTILGGKLGDIYGRKKMFILGALIFGIGSLITAFATNIWMLIIGWSVVEGIGAALMVPASSALIINNFEPKKRGMAFGVYGATAGAASAFGPIIGGFLTSTLSWRWAFGINVFIVIALIVGALLKVSDTSEKLKGYKLDWIGVLLSSLGLVSLSYGIIEYNKEGIPFVILGLALIIAFIAFENYLLKIGKAPLVNIKMFLNRQFTISTLIVASLFAGFSGVITFGLSLYYQSVLGLDAFGSGLGFLPFSIATLIMAPSSVKLSNRFGTKIVVISGLAVGIIANFLLYINITSGSTLLSLSPYLFVFGLGFGAIVAQVTNLALSSVSKEEAGEASGINGTVREVGRTIGIAVIGAVFLSTVISSISNNLNDKVKENAIPAVVANGIIDKISGGDIASVTFGLKKIGSNPVIEQAIKEGLANSSKQAILYTEIFFVMSLLCALLLPNKKN